MKKRLLACILVIAMVLSFGATAVFAEDSTHVSPSFVGDISIDQKDILDSQNSFEFSMTPKVKGMEKLFISATEGNAEYPTKHS
ncbi:hypothetical protein UF75_5057 [Desulfosporosinus sp. I2]|uniref:hypothetical protein n=1 Tax=Desulfosporosinus sp. I2 TaxID=1617025 RepID=UPI00061F1838|nr:hypothetical protein [Desulfosporosinus sp. I2]KJR44554.1 hypothetical protein UF75_5057 [Desulfosporosinus sp. I2]